MRRRHTWTRVLPGWKNIRAEIDIEPRDCTSGILVLVTSDSELKKTVAGFFEVGLGR